MSKRANPTLIGLFVTGGIILLIGGVIFFGSGLFFSKKQTFVLFFNSSLKGLEKGSPVTFRGVPIGQVTKISIIVDPQTGLFRMPVYISIDPKSIFSYSGEGTVSELSYRKMAEVLIKKGLKAQLQIQSIVTGKLQVDLDFYPNAPMHYEGLDKRYIEIPTVPSTVEKVIKRFQEIPINDLIEKLISAINSLDEIIKSGKIGATINILHKNLIDINKNMEILTPQVLKTLKEIQEASISTNKFIGNANKKMQEISDNLKRLTNSTNKFIKRMDSVGHNIEQITSPNSFERHKIRNLLKELERSIRSIRELVDQLNAQPDILIKGR